MIQYTLHLTFYVFMSKLDAKQVWRNNYEMFEFNYVREQMRCTKKHAHVLQGKVATATMHYQCFMKPPSILSTNLLWYPMEQPAQVLLDSEAECEQ